MRILILTIAAIILLAGTAVAENPYRQIALFKTAPAPEALAGTWQLNIRSGVTLVVAMPEEKASSLPKTSIANELLPTQLRERSYSDPDTVAGIQVALPDFSPLNIVLAADDLLNPTCGIKFHLVW